MTVEIENIFLNKLTKDSYKWYPYFNVYEKHLSKFKNKSPKVLEIGIRSGGSLELWNLYFGRGSKIYGVDNDPRVLELRFDFKPDIELGDQEDIEFWKRYTEKRGFFDIIIDDGGHTMSQQENSVVSLFNKLNYGGVYIVEDTHTSYWEEYGGSINKPGTFVEKMKSLVDILHMRHVRDAQPPTNIVNTFHGLESISFYDSMIVLEKEVPKDFKIMKNF